MCPLYIVKVSEAKILSGDNKRVFDSNMDAAKCSADIAVKEALDCSYQIQSATISLLASTNTLTDRCIQGLDCGVATGHYCENVHYMPSYMIDRNNQTMLNPFYHSNANPNCLMLNIIN